MNFYSILRLIAVRMRISPKACLMFAVESGVTQSLVHFTEIQGYLVECISRLWFYRHNTRNTNKIASKCAKHANESIETMSPNQFGYVHVSNPFTEHRYLCFYMSKIIGDYADRIYIFLSLYRYWNDHELFRMSSDCIETHRRVNKMVPSIQIMQSRDQFVLLSPP